MQGQGTKITLKLLRYCSGIQKAQTTRQAAWVSILQVLCPFIFLFVKYISQCQMQDHVVPNSVPGTQKLLNKAPLLSPEYDLDCL